jgi:hypothetical protein
VQKCETELPSAPVSAVRKIANKVKTYSLCSLLRAETELPSAPLSAVRKNANKVKTHSLCSLLRALEKTFGLGFEQIKVNVQNFISYFIRCIFYFVTSDWILFIKMTFLRL